MDRFSIEFCESIYNSLLNDAKSMELTKSSLRIERKEFILLLGLKSPKFETN